MCTLLVLRLPCFWPKHDWVAPGCREKPMSRVGTLDYMPPEARLSFARAQPHASASECL